MTAVSIAMATYNGGRHIRRQLDSLAAQTILPAELVITDDCSPDDTVEILSDFVKAAPFPVRLYRNDVRLGYRANFMRAASLCESQLIGFCDQDDYWYPNKIELSIAPFANSTTLLTYHDADIVREDGLRVGTVSNREAPPAASPWFAALGFTQVFRRSLLDFSLLWQLSKDPLEITERAAHDVWFFFLARVFGEVVFINERLAAYHQHTGNAYGLRKRSAKELIAYVLRDRRPQILNFAEAANNRAAILSSAAQSLTSPQWLQRAAAQIDFYQKLGAVCRERYEIHDNAKSSKRLVSFYRVFKDTHYANTLGLGRKAWLIDLFAAILGSGSSIANDSP